MTALHGLKDFIRQLGFGKFFPEHYLIASDINIKSTVGYIVQKKY